ncbi:20 kda chaperonin [Quercus suber]|uniref:20 kDa chaperonin, chloroplastic n=1 Tax=Quercus suber TaxID=58331 RepID=A0AAW0IJJ4_QUESU
MATAQLTASSISTRTCHHFQGLAFNCEVGPSVGHCRVGSVLSQKSFGVWLSKLQLYTSIKPLGDRVLVKIKTAEEKTDGGILLPTTAQTKPQGDWHPVVYSKYAGTELDFMFGILETDDVKDLKPLNDRVLIKVAEAEQKTAGGSKGEAFYWTVIAVGPGPLDEEGNRKPLSLTQGSTVMFSKYAGNDFKGKDGFDYIALRASDVMAVLS